jgi:hypothetical protein
MSLFDGRGTAGPMPTNLAEMGWGLGQSISRGLLDPYMESKGFVSEENQILEIMKGADLTDAKSVSDTFNKIMMISPEAASEFQKQVLPMLQANQNSSRTYDPGTFRKSLDTAAYALNLDPENLTAEQKKKVYALAERYRRGDKYEEGSAKALVTESSKIHTEGADAGQNLAKFEQMLNILPNIYTGWGGEGWQEVQRVGALFGMPSMTKAAGQAEIFAQGGMDMALEYIKQTTGAISDREFLTFISMAPGLSRTELGNKLMLRTAKAYAEFRQKKAIEYNRWVNSVEGTPQLSDWSAHLMEWANKPENIIVLPTDDEYIESQTAMPSSEAQLQLQTDVNNLSKLSDEELQAAAAGVL